MIEHAYILRKPGPYLRVRTVPVTRPNLRFRLTGWQEKGGREIDYWPRDRWGMAFPLSGKCDFSCRIPRFTLQGDVNILLRPTFQARGDEFSAEEMKTLLEDGIFVDRTISRTRNLIAYSSDVSSSARKTALETYWTWLRICMLIESYANDACSNNWSRNARACWQLGGENSSFTDELPR